MVRIHIKHGNESQFLYDIPACTEISELLPLLIDIYNARLKVERITSELELLAKHGITLPPNMQGLTDEQVQELKLRDEWAEKCIPSGGAVFCKDEVGRRNGQAPNAKMAEVITKTIKDARTSIDKKLVETNACMTKDIVKDALDQLRGAVMIVYPMGLPPHDPIQMEFEEEEDLAGTQASLKVISLDKGTLWWAGKELLPGKKLADYVGKNDKTKIVAKLQKRGTGAPGREPIVTEDQKKQMMLHAYRRQEELKKLEETEDNTHMNSDWADPSSLKKQFQGMQNIKWGPGRGFS